MSKLHATENGNIYRKSGRQGSAGRRQHPHHWRLEEGHFETAVQHSRLMQVNPKRIYLRKMYFY